MDNPTHRRSGPNRLGNETSPYLLQHANNPVNWYPWGEEALELARKLDRPIFLSIGYSACHWCHVMEHESFENTEIAALMNELFINVKVDREERPDLDQIYMSAVQLMTGRGGWPMSTFLTPDLRPFYGGTYWPPESRMGMPGFRDILRGVDDAWRNRRNEVDQNAARLTAAIVESAGARGTPSPISDALLRNAAQVLIRSADRVHGGFGRAPKFPHSMDIRVLLRAFKRFGDADALAVAQLTLDKMAGGGIYDHLGGGFHRYSTDERWLAPHFEKMLYDNALMVPAYLEAYQATGKADYARVVRETLDYALREMTQSEGGFYSTQDADSEGVEGQFFVWSEAEILSLLGPEEGRLFNACYDVSRHGNWEEANILNRPKTHAQAAEELGLQEAALEEVLARGRRKLFDVRSRRVWPGRDDKVLVSWNGLMLSAFSSAAQVLDEPCYAEAAAKSATFLLRALRQPDGGLWHSYKDGRARFNAYLDDYACLTDGLVDVFQATQDAGFLTAAVDLAEKMVERFEDADGGGFFYTSHDHERLIARQKDLQDNATPSGNSMAATALLRLGRLIGRPDFEARAMRTLEVLGGIASEYPAAAGQVLLAMDFAIGPAYEAVIVAGDALETAEVLRTLHRPFLPNKLVVVITPGKTLPRELAALSDGRTARYGRPTTYLCVHRTCGLPVVGAEGLANALSSR